MEREMNPRQRTAGGGPVPETDDVAQVRDKLEGMMQAADEVLDSIRHVPAEDYLQQSRQRGAQ